MNNNDEFKLEPFRSFELWPLDDLDDLKPNWTLKLIPEKKGPNFESPVTTKKGPISKQPSTVDENNKPKKSIIGNKKNKQKTNKKRISGIFPLGNKKFLGVLALGSLLCLPIPSFSKATYSPENFNTVFDTDTDNPSENKTYLSEVINNNSDAINLYKGLINTHFKPIDSMALFDGIPTNNEEIKDRDRANILISDNREEILKLCKDLYLANLLDKKNLTGNFEDYKLEYNSINHCFELIYTTHIFNYDTESKGKIKDFNVSVVPEKVLSFKEKLKNTVFSMLLQNDDPSIVGYLNALQRTTEELTLENIKKDNTHYNKVAEKICKVFEATLCNLLEEKNKTQEPEQPSSKNDEIDR